MFVEPEIVKTDIVMNTEESGYAGAEESVGTANIRKMKRSRSKMERQYREPVETVTMV